MQVIATQKGYYAGKVREPGERFVLSDEKHLGAWMKPVDADEGPKPVEADKPKAKAAQEKETEVKPPVEPAKAKDAVTGDDI